MKNPLLSAVFNDDTPLAFAREGRVSAAVLGRNPGANNFLMQVVGDSFQFNARFGDMTPNIGDTLDFEVVNTQGTITLKLITKAQSMQSEKNISNENIIDLYKQSGFVRDISEGQDDSQQIEKERAIAALKRSIENSDNTRVAAVNQLMSKGVPFGSIDIIAIDNALNEVTPHLTEAEHNLQENIKNTLTSHGLPHTADNIATLQKAWEYFEQSKNPHTIAKSITKGNVTLGSLYMAHYGGEVENQAPAMPNFDRELEKLYTNQNIEYNPKTAGYGKLLYEHNAPITKENVQAFDIIQNTATSYILDQAAMSILQGEPITQIPLYNTPTQATYNSYNQLLQDLPYLGEKEISSVLAQDKPLTLYNLRTVDTSHYPPTANEGYIYEPPAEITQRRQLAEIQLKLTYEAAYRLAHKNINIDTMPLEQALEEIRIVEKEYYAKVLGTPDTAAPNVISMVNLYDALANINTLLPQVYSGIAKVPESLVSVTLGNINEATLANKQAMGYEPFMTVPNAKYGDSFAKVAGDFAPILEEIGLEATEENVRVASILSRSGIDVTYLSMMEGKVLHKKLDYVQENLHPNIAAQLVKDGTNPLQVHLNDLITYIDNHNDNNGVGVKDNLASHILEMQNTLTEDERTKMMAVYRALRQVANYGAAALGINMRSGNTLTLGNLLDSAQYYAKTGAKESFVDVAPTSTNQAPPETNIRSILETMENDYRGLLLKEASTKLNPGVLQTADYNATLPSLLEKLDRMENRHLDRVQELIQQIKAQAESNPQALLFLQKANTPVTMLAMEAMALLANPKSIREKLQDTLDSFAKTEKAEKTADIPESPLDYLTNDGLNTKQVEEILEEIEETGETGGMGQQTEETAKMQDSPQKVDLHEMQVLRKAMELQNNTNIGSFALPIRFMGNIETLHMYVQNPLGKEITAVISLTTQKFGDIDAFLKAEGSNVNLYINMQEQTAESFATNQKQLIEKFSDSGFSLQNIILNGRYDDINVNDQKDFDFNEISSISRHQVFAMATCITNFMGGL
ncbi:MAG: DUF6240 domain-containing protein [Defluviitaleaceae bacterium]|nr:DUF6240 domain-containing protein [Defluviitaleaceae bacterium]